MCVKAGPKVMPENLLPPMDNQSGILPASDLGRKTQHQIKFAFKESASGDQDTL